MSENNYVGSITPLYIPCEKTVIEKRAPTDDSIRLFNEMKEKAYDSILDTIVIKNNTLNLSGVIYQDHKSYSTNCKYKVILNKQEITGEIFVSKAKIHNKKELCRAISKDISKHITE